MNPSSVHLRWKERFQFMFSEGHGGGKRHRRTGFGTPPIWDDADLHTRIDWILAFCNIGSYCRPHNRNFFDFTHAVLHYDCAGIFQQREVGVTMGISNMDDRNWVVLLTDGCRVYGC